MIIKKLKDEHPGKWQDGIEVFMVKAYCESFMGSKNEPFLTGFTQKGVSSQKIKNTGMFGPEIEPVQVISKNGEEWVFTMCNCTSITRHDVRQLLKKGRHIVERRYDDGAVYFRLEMKVIETEEELNKLQKECTCDFV